MTVGTDERNRALVDWYRRHGRRLPWRAGRNPYRVLVSEVMLHQTQAERVVPFYEAFLDRFPTVETLAVAPFAEVAAAWSGLGYNRRAKHLHRTARMVVDGGWPDTVEGLRRLPGVGEYTAGAVGSIAFGLRVAAVDTNVRRVLGRWHGEALDGSALTRAAEEDLGEDAGTWNQAVMDLGATVCRPRSPGCDRCPVQPWCAGPEVYVPPPRQGRFEGSVRQARGAVVRRLVAGAATFDDLGRVTGLGGADLGEVIDGLVDDALVVETDEGTLTLADD